MKSEKERIEAYVVFEGNFENEFKVQNLFFDPDEAIFSCIEDEFFFILSEEVWVNGSPGIVGKPNVRWRKIFRTFLEEGE